MVFIGNRSYQEKEYVLSRFPGFQKQNPCVTCSMLVYIPWYSFTITETLAPAARENVSLNGSKAPLFFFSSTTAARAISLFANIHYSTHVTLAHLHQL